MREPILDRRVALLGASAMVALPAAARADCMRFGHYSGRIETVWEPGVGKFRAVRAVAFVEPCGKRWAVPANALFSGESIPGFLWYAIGSPLTGLFQDATLFHDYFCSTRTEPAAAVHTMFYEALLASGVATWTAAKFYYGVKLGGPSWDALQVANARLGAGAQPAPPTRGFRLAAPSAPAPHRRGMGFGRAMPPSGASTSGGGAPNADLCRFTANCGTGALSVGTGGEQALTAARLVVDRNQAAADQFARFAAGQAAGAVDLARIDAAAAAARAAIERQGWSPADRLRWEMQGIGVSPS